MRLAVTSEHFALFALTLTKAISMPAWRFRLFTVRVSEMTRRRSPSGFEPSPPRRHDCETIASPSSGDFVSGGATSDGAAAVAARLASCARRTFSGGIAAEWLSASLGCGSISQIAHPTTALAAPRVNNH